MTTSTTNLMEKVYDLFSATFPPAHGSGAFLAFEKLGIPISAGMFKLRETDAALSPSLAIERLSEIANAVPEVDGDSVRRSGRTLDAMAALLVQQAMPVSAESAAALGAARDEAKKHLEGTLGSLEGPFQFHPVYASPADWYVPEAAGNWTLHTVGETSGPPAPAGPAPPPRRVPVRPPAWRVLPEEMRPAMSQPGTRASTMMAMAALREPDARPVVRPSMAGRPAMMPARVAMAAPVARAVSPSTVMVRPGVAMASAAAVPAAASPVMIARPLAVAQAAAQVNATTTPQPVASPGIDMAFEHCIVTLSRPWFPEGFVQVRNWYVPGYSRGTFSAATGDGDAGLMPVLAIGFVAVRNLRISARWSQEDLAAVQGSASFGPFSLVGRTFDAGSGTLSCPGTQIIGWFCEALPVLPPAGDPALAAAPGAGAPTPS